jgi:hypothetical protein
MIRRDWDLLWPAMAPNYSKYTAPPNDTSYYAAVAPIQLQCPPRVKGTVDACGRDGKLVSSECFERYI